jgi:hypothetical protein
MTLALFAGLFLMGSQAQATTTATVSVVHGVPNTPVNVFVNGKLTLTDFKPGTVAGPLQLPAGSYTVTVSVNDGRKSSTTQMQPIGSPSEVGNIPVGMPPNFVPMVSTGKPKK